MKLNDKGYRGQSGLTVVQAVEIALQPQLEHPDAMHVHNQRINLQERMLAELIAVLHESGKLSNADVLRLIGKFRFEIA